MPVQPAVEALHAELAAAGGLGLFGNDDGFAIGPPGVAFEAVVQFSAAILEDCCLTVQVDKTQVYLASGEKPDEAPASKNRAGLMVEGEWAPGFMCYGVAIGYPAFVRSQLSKKQTELISDIDKVTDLLKEDGKNSWVLLSASLSSQLDYLLTLHYPSDALQIAADVDGRI